MPDGAGPLCGRPLARRTRPRPPSGRRLLVLADSSKWGVIGISSIARLDEADTLVTDGGLDDEARRIAEEQVHELLIAGGDDAAGDDLPMTMPRPVADRNALGGPPPEPVH